uniref:Sulfatase N-terminal domain-containing protein n=1 Tax=Panagrolaimus sp. PS1159 TaxID=55785 RepID=A0AC35FKY8_9BILA
MSGYKETNSLEIINYDEPNTNTSKLLFDQCDLPKLDPWDLSIAKHLKRFKDPSKLCRSKVEQLSKLINGQLFLFLPKTANVNCQRRCLLPKSDYDLEFGDWINVENGTRPNCDIFEVECNKTHNNDNYFVIYKFLHSQIYRPEMQETHVREDNQKPDVHIIVLDSVSESQFIRSMSKTRYVLRENYEAIAFRHLNKIGLNSRPNGFAFLLGKSIYNIRKSPVSQGYRSDYKNEAFCNKHLDQDQFIGFRFQEDGYKTMMSEDWAQGVFNWPNCKGFNITPTNHYMRPFQIRIEGNKKFRDYEMKNIIYRDSCLESYHYNMKYLQDFIDTYPDKPKFSITWMSYLAHSDINALYHIDEYFYRFFKNNEEKLNNSFVIIMGDHGNRYGPFRETFVGEAEDNNPFLFLSIPAKMRKDVSLMETLRKNAKQLITHYDIYATLNEITNVSFNLFNMKKHFQILAFKSPDPETID